MILLHQKSHIHHYKPLTVQSFSKKLRRKSEKFQNLINFTTQVTRTYLNNEFTQKTLTVISTDVKQTFIISISFHARKACVNTQNSGGVKI